METLKNKLVGDEAHRQRQVDFLKENQIHIINYYSASEFDYQVFVDCMEIYMTSGENYFDRYKHLYSSIQNQNLEKGIKGFYKTQKNLHLDTLNLMDEFEKAIEARLKDMYFFGIDEVNGFTSDDYKRLLNEAKSSTILEEEHEVDEEKARVEKYFCFDDFDLNKFEWHYKACIKALESKQYRADEWGDMERRMYLIVLFVDGIAMKIGNTQNVSSWVHENHEEGATYGLYAVEEEYVKELKVKVCLQYPTIQAYSAMIQVTNKVYANLKQAKKVYQYLNGLNLAHLKQIIEVNDLEQHFIGGATIIEKAELDKCVQEFLNDH